MLPVELQDLSVIYYLFPLKMQGSLYDSMLAACRGFVSFGNARFRACFYDIVQPDIRGTKCMDEYFSSVKTCYSKSINLLVPLELAHSRLFMESCMIWLHSFVRPCFRGSFCYFSSIDAGKSRDQLLNMKYSLV